MSTWAYMVRLLGISFIYIKILEQFPWNIFSIWLKKWLYWGLVARLSDDCRNEEGTGC